MHRYVHTQSERINNKTNRTNIFENWKSGLKIFRSQLYYFYDFLVSLKLFLKYSLFVNLILVGSFS